MQLEIYKYGSSVLRKKAQIIEEIDEDLLQLIDAMIEKMYASDGIGLAAPQVGISKRLIVVDLGEDKAEAMINPRIEWISEEIWETEEGCLSLPGVIAPVVRPLRIKVVYFNKKGEEVELECSEMLARCIQHEIDHLNGVLFIDRVKPADLVKWSGLLKEIKNEGKKQK